MKLTIQELQNLGAFLNRVDLKGNEAEALVSLKYKIAKEAEGLNNKETSEKVAKKVVKEAETK